ncbi:MAG TPA: hypothetical protein VGZ32_03085 [Actinocrinis sp.]|jgi:membrane protein implicated in regulation of membrane protease activity|uniref:hypothetical protein n=1 Tax=Actinocrinis sp. TaxID=1920516 RepID=UPI002DDD45A8|nr:hypothetical protein [Actinocrinis sp.]HEV3169290.1 hypothetical protein [Actinocrinis sp.]
MRPQGAAGALVAIAIGAILTYAVSFTVSGVNIHTVGVIIMAVGAVALAILLVRSVGGSRRRDQPPQKPVKQVRGRDGSYLQDPPDGAPPVAATRISTEVYTAPGQQADQPPLATTRDWTPRQR